VLERHGDAIRFHPTLLSFAGHYRYEPRPVAVARGNEKGRVERAIGYVRKAFFAAPDFTDLDDLNAQAKEWCLGMAADRRCPAEPERRVREVFNEEVERLLALPETPLPLFETVAVKVGKTPYVRFDLNDYTIPHTHVMRTLTVFAEPHEVRIFDGTVASLLVWTAPGGIERARMRSLLLISDKGDRPWNRLSASEWIRRNTFSSFTG
jgi:hypothetical protein